jgi:hypothetical protein
MEPELLVSPFLQEEKNMAELKVTARAVKKWFLNLRIDIG